MLGVSEDRGSDWTNQKPFEVTPELLSLPWRGRVGEDHARVALSCGLCMELPEIGDEIRWMAVPEGAPNIFVCAECDGPDALVRWQVRWVHEVKPILDRWT